ncbi:MAG TPA: pilus assembly protein TadG-related protein [Anaerolineales bacterium]|nr:pilus assembly protein TadG-related protein [Anaerolineales bacterium]HLO33566.1 pilus assembly protein TadG-related protein [Anaerolineales bacterium]
MKTIKSEHGQALILIALAAVGLFAFTALAIDGSAKFSDRRHAQNAADAAALAGAVALTNGKTSDVVVGGVSIPMWKLSAQDRALENGYDDNHVTNEVEVYKCHEAGSSCGPYDGNPYYIQVIITSHVRTYFATVIGVKETVNTVQAIAYWSAAGPAYGLDLLKSLSPQPCSGQNGNLVLGGNGNINLNGGGAFVNSPGTAGECGLEQAGCPQITITGGNVTSVGSGNINLSSSSSTCTKTNTLPPQFTYNNDPFPFPPAMPPEPSECISPAGQYSSDPTTQKTTLTPGKYYEFPPKGTSTSPVYEDVFMQPGVYCVEDVVKLSDKKLILTGYNVTIFIRSGYKFDIQGGKITLTAPTTGPYAGYLIIVDSNFSGTPLNCNINGNSQNTYTGTIFAPYCDMTFNGTTESGNPDITYNTQVVAYTIKLDGSSTINFNYNPNYVAQSAPQVGMMR